MEFKTFRRTLLLAAVLFVPAGTSMAANLYAFGGRDIAVPSILPEGSVMSRYTFTPMQLCGKPSCDLIGVSLYNKGSVWDPIDGPDLNTNVPGLSVRLLLDGIPASSRFKGTFSQIAEIQLFRNSTPLSDGQFASGAFNSYFLITYKDGLIASGTSSIRLTGSVTTINATCQVADQTVKLQSIAAARLNGVGTYAAVTPFNLVVAGCPRGYNRVGYSLQAVGGRGGRRLGCIAAPGGQHRDRRIDPGHRRGRRSATDGTLVAGDRVRQEHRRGVLDPDESVLCADRRENHARLSPGRDGDPARLPVRQGRARARLTRTPRRTPGPAGRWHRRC